MYTVTLCAKVCNDFQRKYIEEFLKSTLRGLKVLTEICEVTPRGWVQIAVSGEDENVALRYLASEIGLCPTRLEEVGKISQLKGYIVSIDKSRSELNVDIGVFSPKTVDATIPLQRLQAQLVDGRKVAMKKVAELYGLRENLPLTIKISGVDKENSHIEAMLSEKQLVQYGNWTKSLLDRLIIIGSSIHEVRLVLKKAGLDRDVVNIEPLGLFEHAVVCKLGTDAAGLISKIGRHLRNATFSVFNPRKIVEFLGDYMI